MYFPVFFPEQVALQQRPGQLLDTKRDAVGVLDNPVENLDRKHFAAGDASDQCLGFPLPESTQCHGGHPRLAGPRRLKLRAEGHDHEHGQPADALGDPIQ